MWTKPEANGNQAIGFDLDSFYSLPDNIENVLEHATLAAWLKAPALQKKSRIRMALK